VAGAHGAVAEVAKAASTFRDPRRRMLGSVGTKTPFMIPNVGRDLLSLSIAFRDA